MKWIMLHRGKITTLVKIELKLQKNKNETLKVAEYKVATIKSILVWLELLISTTDGENILYKS